MPTIPLPGIIHARTYFEPSKYGILLLVKTRHYCTFIIVKTFLIQLKKRTSNLFFLQGDTKKRELLKNPTKIEEIQEKKIIDRNWTITTCLLRESNPNYQCLKITSCRYAFFHCHYAFQKFPFFCVTLCVLHALMQHTQGDTKKRELFKCIVAVKECIRGGGRHLQDVIFKHW